MNGVFARAAIAAALLLGACGGVSHTVRTDVVQPRTVAVLPFAGDAPVALRQAARQLLHSRLAARGYDVPETAWVDRVLAEHGWLRDPEHFDARPLPLAEVMQALGTDALAVGSDLDESSFNVLVLRRHAFGGELAIRDAQGRDFWRADHGASTLGGFLLTSGQVLTELRAQAEHGTPMASLALTDEFVADVVATVPKRGEARPTPGNAPAVGAPRTFRERGQDGADRVVVEVDASRGSTVRFDLVGQALGVPMAELPGTPGRFRGAREVPAGAPIARVAVHARDAFGRESHGEGTP